MKPCISCQSELIEEARFCWNCGESQRPDGTTPDTQSAIDVNGIRAAVSTARIPSGEWVALGSVVDASLASPLLHPAWMIVGTGTSRESAVDDLRDEMQRRVSLLSSWSRLSDESPVRPLSVL